jgi:hypothetical protein
MFGHPHTRSAGSATACASPSSDGNRGAEFGCRKRAASVGNANARDCRHRSPICVVKASVTSLERALGAKEADEDLLLLLRVSAIGACRPEGQSWLQTQFVQSMCSNSATPSDTNTSRRLDFHQSLLKVSDDVFLVLDPDRQPNDIGAGPSLNLLRIGQLSVGGRSGVNDQRSGIPNIGQMRK